MYRVKGFMGVGNMPLNTFNGQEGAQRTASAIFDHIPQYLTAGRLSHQAPGNFFVLTFQVLNDFFGAKQGGAFLIAGQQESDATTMSGMQGQESFYGSDHCRNGSFHIGSAATYQPVVFNIRCKRDVGPAFPFADRYNIGMACKAVEGAFVSFYSPEIIHRACGFAFAKTQVLAAKAQCGKFFCQKLLATRILRCNRWSTDQGLCKCNGRGCHE